jgi:single-strand DNA-binding protein
LAASVNEIVLVGNVGSNPKMRYTADGQAVGTVSVAATDTRKDVAGEKSEHTK